MSKSYFWDFVQFICQFEGFSEGYFTKVHFSLIGVNGTSCLQI